MNKFSFVQVLTYCNDIDDYPYKKDKDEDLGIFDEDYEEDELEDEP